MAARDDLIALGFQATLWHDPEKDAFATIKVNGHEENHRVRSRPFKLWLAGRYHRAIGQGAPRGAFEDAFCSIEAEAVHSGPESEHSHRIAGFNGAIYLDLGDAEWRTVEITSKSWRLIDEPPVRFVRTRGMRALPAPKRGGHVDALRPFLNVETEGDFRLIVGWLLAAFRPGKPFPILDLNGEHGSSKSTTAKVIRGLVDPNSPSIRAAPGGDRDLTAAARNSWIVSFDNMSWVPPTLSDGLCRLSTGGGLGGRQLYTDHDEAVFDALRPCLINGINELATRADLADRAIPITLPTIPEDRRKPESEFWESFETARPLILGALLDAVSCALRRIDDVQIPKLPRMADLALWVTAAEEALGWPTGAFMEAYSENRMAAVEATIESDPVASALIQFMDGEERWTGTATELLGLLEAFAPEGSRFSRTWPKAANALSQKLRRAAPSLRKLGIELADYRESDRDRRRCWQIIRTPPQMTVRTVRTVRRNEEPIDLEGSPENGSGRSSVGPTRPHNSSIPQRTASSDGSDGSDDDFGDPNTWGLDND